jgi:hypothetical protein
MTVVHTRYIRLYKGWRSTSQESDTDEPFFSYLRLCDAEVGAPPSRRGGYMDGSNY